MSQLNRPYRISFLFFLIFAFTVNKSDAQSYKKTEMEKAISDAKTPDTTRLRLMIYLVDSLYDVNLWEPLNLKAYELGKKLANAQDQNSQYLGKIFLADAINNIGVAAKSRGNLKQTLDYYSEALRLREEIGYHFGIASSYNNISAIFSEQGDTATALSYLQKSLSIRIKLDDKHGIARSLENIGRIYLQKGEAEKANDYFLQSYKIYESIGSQEGLCRVTTDLGLVYFLEKNYTVSQNTLLQSFELAKNLGDKENMAFIFAKIAEINVIENKLPTATDYCNQALSIAKQYNFVSIEGNCYYILSQIAEKSGNANEALRLYKKFIDIDNKINNFNIQNHLANYSSTYESAKKNAITQNEQEQKIKDATEQRFFAVAFLILLAIISLILFFLYYSNSKANIKLAEKNEQIELAREHAEESERYKTQFLSNMSHEIRTPMHAILGMSSLLIDTKLDGKQKSYVSAIKNSSENLLLIINNVLDFSKLEEGKMSLESSPFLLRQTITDVYNTLRFKTEEKGLDFSVQLDTELSPYLLGDSFRLYQVLINLTSNAIKFTKKGRVAINVSLEENIYEGDRKVRQKVRFSVTDTGIGIAKDKWSSIFESFQQASIDTSRKYGGSGLGLSISQRLVSIRNGKIEVESEIGKGSNFYFILEYPISNIQAFQIAQGLISAKNDYAPLSNLRILLAEDNEYNRIVAIESLQKAIPNVEIDEVENGNLALDAVLEKKYDVILMDISMPELGGYEAAARIRKSYSPSIQQVPIIALTAYSYIEEESNLMEAGINAYVHKPFRIEELLSAISKVLHNKTQAVKTHEPSNKIDIDNEKLINLSFLAEFTDNDAEQMKYFISKFVLTIPKSIAILEEAIREGDFAKIKKNAHNIKPQIEFMGINKALKLVVDIENYALEKEGLDIILVIFDELKLNIEKSITILNNINPTEA